MQQDGSTSDLTHNVQKGLLDDLISAVESGEMTVSEMREAAQFILDKTRAISSEADVQPFLKELAEKWPLFKNTKAVFGAKDVEDKEQEVISKLSDYIKGLDTN